MELTIIIPTVGNKDILVPTLDAVLIATASLPVEIILVDDSENGIVDIDNARLKVVRSYGRGASNARNEGLKYANSALILFLDDDILVSESNIKETLRLHSSSSKRAYNYYWVYPDNLMKILPETKFGRYIFDEGLCSNHHRLEGSYESLPSESVHGGLTSQYFSIERKWLEEVGGYDSIPFAGIEDLLLYKKLKNIGVEVILLKDQVVYQDESNRIHIDKLFNRYRTGALTRRIAALRGHEDLGVHFSDAEKVKGEIGLLLFPILKLIEKHVPYGILYRRIVNYILFTGTYLGYYKDTLPAPYAEEFNN